MTKRKASGPGLAGAPQAPARTKDKVCIVGCSQSKADTPFEQKEEYEFWGVNNLFLTLPNEGWTRWFEIHQITHEEGHWLRRGGRDFRGQPVQEYLEGLGKLKCPVYMQASNPLVRNAVPYPLQEVVEKYGRYFTNTVSWEIALAIHMGFREIRIYGVDMAVDSEYFWQRPSCEYFLGLAKGMGVEIFIPDDCDLLKARFLYGFDEVKELGWTNKVEKTLKKLDEKRQKALQDAAFLQKQADQYTGAIQGIRDMHKTWKNVSGG